MGTIFSVHTHVLNPVTIKNITYYLAAGTISQVVYRETMLPFFTF